MHLHCSENLCGRSLLGSINDNDMLDFSRRSPEARPQGAPTESPFQGGAAVESQSAGETEDARSQHGSGRSQTGMYVYRRDVYSLTQLAFLE